MEYCGVEPWLPARLEDFRPEADPATGAVAIEDRWIFSRLNACAAQANRAIETYRYHEAAQVLWHFFWHEFCDWYLELKKLEFRENSGLTPGSAGAAADASAFMNRKRAAFQILLAKARELSMRSSVRTISAPGEAP